MKELPKQISKRTIATNIAMLESHNFDKNNDQVLLVAYKKEQELEVWIKKRQKLIPYTKYAFTAFSGIIGPKLNEGDKQIPEGIYLIELLNPKSRFHLSMRINFPNKFDKERAAVEGRNQLGSDIYIHGKNSSKGCIAIGNETIEDLYFLVWYAWQNEISIIIAPQKDMKLLTSKKNLEEKDSNYWDKKLYHQIANALQSFPKK